MIPMTHMTPKELENCLEKLDISNEEFAQVLDVSKAAVRSWLVGDRKVPATVAKLVKFFNNFPKMLSEF